MRSNRIPALLLAAVLLICLLSGFGRSPSSRAASTARSALPEALQQVCDLGIADEETLRRGLDILTEAVAAAIRS